MFIHMPSTLLNDESISVIQEAMQTAYKKHGPDIALGFDSITVPNSNKDQYIPVISTLVNVFRVLLDNATCRGLVEELFNANKDSMEKLIEESMVNGAYPTSDSSYLMIIARMYTLDVFTNIEAKHTLMGCNVGNVDHLNSKLIIDNLCQEVPLPTDIVDKLLAGK